MTVEERIRVIQDKINRDKQRAMLMQQREEREKQAAFKKFEELSGRIKDLIRVGDFCKTNSIQIPKQFEYKAFRFYNDHCSYLCLDKLNDYILSDGDTLYKECKATGKRETEALTKAQIEQFCDGFEIFEYEFYKWIDKQCEMNTELDYLQEIDSLEEDMMER